MFLPMIATSRIRNRLLPAMLSSIAVLPLASAAQPLFDAHLHYNAGDAARYSPGDIVELLQSEEVKYAVVTSRPPDLVSRLYHRAPTLILPLLGVYRTPEEKETWMQDEGLPARVAQALKQDHWRGVGELHIFAKERRNPVFLSVVELATARGLPLLMHCDPAVIDTLFEQAPGARVVWAHAGAYPYPPLLRDYLERYPGLHIDLSVRDQRIAPGGQLGPDWELLLLEYPDRFLIGVDTYRTARWKNYSRVAKQIRKWLQQLPEEVSDSIAYRNGARLFGQELND